MPGARVAHNAPAVLAGGHAASCEAPQPLGELLVRQSQRGVHVGALRVSVIRSPPWPAECAVEHFFDGTQGGSVVLGTDQLAEAGERSIEKLGLGRGQVVELGDVEMFPQLFASADLLSTSVATFCAIVPSEFMCCGAVLEQARCSTPVGWPAAPRSLCEPDCMLLIVGVLWTML